MFEWLGSKYCFGLKFVVYTNLLGFGLYLKFKGRDEHTMHELSQLDHDWVTYVVKILVAYNNPIYVSVLASKCPRLGMCSILIDSILRL